MQYKILVTGAAGFIGSHLCEALLNAGHQVTGIDNFDAFYDRSIKERNLAVSIANPSFQFIEGDAGNHTDLNKCAVIPDIVVHLAAKAGVQPSLKSPLDYVNANIHVSTSLLEWMKEKGVKKMAFASSSSVYGHTATVPFREEQGTDSPISPYAFTKKSCELINYTYHQLYKLSVVNMRFFTVYGERQRPDLAIYKFVKAIKSGQPISMYGNGETSRDYTYWKDTVQGVCKVVDFLMENESVYTSVNLGNENPVKLKNMIDEIGKVLNRTPVIIIEDKKAGDVDITYASIDKAAKLLNYAPETSLQAGLKNFVSWFNEQ